MGIFKCTCVFPYWNCHMKTVNPNGKIFPFGVFFVNRQMFINSILERVSDWITPLWKWAISKNWLQMVSQNDSSSQVDFKFPFGDPNMETGSHMFWILFPYGNLLLTVSILWSTYGNRDPDVLNPRWFTVPYEDLLLPVYCRWKYISFLAKKIGGVPALHDSIIA